MVLAARDYNATRVPAKSEVVLSLEYDSAAASVVAAGPGPGAAERIRAALGAAVRCNARKGGDPVTNGSYGVEEVASP